MKPSAPVYQVTDLVNEMRQLMEASYPEVWIEGELSSLSTPASGHLYFSLKDERTQLRCAMFRNRAGINRYKPKAGDLVKVRAKISVYTARGDLQCIVQHIEEAGEGVLQRRFEELKLKLSQAGVFAAEAKQKLPSFPDCIGIITSPTGAAVNDILSTLERRCPNIPVIIYPAVVQGEGAPGSLIQALADASSQQRCDVIIIGRGGGSLEDLWGFNDENLANAIYQCPIPIISAVGHEIDITIADYVADLRAPTPTAAAELLSPDYQLLQQKLVSLAKRLPQSLNRYIEKQAQRVDSRFQQLQHPQASIRQNKSGLSVTGGRLKRAMQQQLATQTKEITQCSSRILRQVPNKKVEQKRISTTALSHRLFRIQKQLLDSKNQKYKSLGSQLHLVSPLATLERGFSIARDENEVIIKDAKTIKPGDSVAIQLRKGSLLCDVNNVTK